jgi:predicted permease
VIFSLAPAIQFWRPDLMSTLKQQVVTAGSPLRFRRLSVAVQIGLSLLLLVGAGLFVRTLRNLKTLDLGFTPDHLVTFRVNPQLAGYTKEQIPSLYQRILERVQTLPGIRSVGATSSAEINDSESTSNITVAGYKEKPEENMDIRRTEVMPGYFPALNVQLLAGRTIIDADNAKTAKIAVVNEKFAKYFFGSAQQAIGHYFGWGGGSSTKIDIQIVGVINDTKHSTVRGEIDRATFLPYLQNPEPEALTFYIRTIQSPQSAQSGIRAAMQNLDSKLVLDSFVTMEEQIDISLGVERMIALLATSFAGLALFMAAVGLYGVLAYSTAQRTREIGVRMALGASRFLVLRMILMEVVWLAGA